MKSAIFFTLVARRIFQVKFYCCIFLITCLFAVTIDLSAQKQLVLLKKEEIVLRLSPGDEFIYRLKNEKRIRTSYVNNIFDNAVLAHNDTVPFHTIDRIYFRQPRFYNTLGGALVVGGAGLFLIDQINVVIVNGDSPSLDSWVSTVSLSAVIAGLPLMLIKKKSQKINFRYHLLTVKKGSIFYLDDPREPISPFIQN
jgi:hypothetical protein